MKSALYLVIFLTMAIATTVVSGLILDNMHITIQFLPLFVAITTLMTIYAYD